MANVELDNEFIELFYGITKSPIPDEINLQVLKAQLNSISTAFKDVGKTLKPHVQHVIKNDKEDACKENAILIVDDLGVITYQLKVLLSNFDYDIDCSQEIYDAVGKFKARRYQYVIMDLYIPTEREGFILLTELKKLANISNEDTVIGVITASPRKEIETQCLNRGADFFLEKNNDWQNQLVKIMEEYINSGNETEEF